jgi:hypothetical protein
MAASIRQSRINAAAASRLNDERPSITISLT